MKKTIFFLLTACFMAVNGLCQTAPAINKKNPCIGCKVTDTGTCKAPKIIDLYYDTCSKRIIKLGHDGLVNKKIYVFRICNINSAFYDIKITGANITKTLVLPAILAPFNGDNSIAKSKAAHSLTKSVLNEDANENVQNYYFFQQLKYDYDELRYISDVTKNLLDSLSGHPSNMDRLHQQASAILDSISGIIKSKQRGMLDSISGILKSKQQQMLAVAKDHILPTIVLTKPAIDSIITAYSLLSEFVKPSSVYSLKTFNLLVTSLLADFGSRVSLVFSPNNNLPIISVEEKVAIKRADSAIVKASGYLLKCPNIIYSVKNSTCCIISSPYQATADYFQLNATLVAPKFSNKPDTVSVNKITFYRTRFWKAIDVSTGFFYDNLASKAYYFKNSVPTQEIQSSADVSIGALFHSYWVFDSRWKAGPCAGIGVSLVDAKSKYFVGGSILIGKKNEFAISYGYAMASLPKVSNLYQTNWTTSTSTAAATTSGSSNSITTGTTPSNTTTTTTSTSTTVTSTTQPIGSNGTVNTYNKFQGGIFIGFTYSFLKF
ncbi:hypothetical protein HDF24_18950 [Mucilaginibacter sp. X4EP1]|uniref:hypothetical protein n=1 Tax=Mucilaginibacter sp. X4EP1 TaxID=2723092 RepID=UPI00216A462D|nr:hypothetical protein [Mucilaginibacter sp. X4EP1]MCS3813348.1 hypothetical protein [Mucilaginibacter sp. X4EP1]